jgi:DNA-binding transcriptional LysR family regulator
MQMKNAEMQQLDWDDLRIFSAVVDAGSLRGASLKLDVNHSTVFRRLHRLEESVGARLFDRLPEGYSLTQVGEELRAHAERVRAEIDALQLAILGKDFNPRGTIRITAPDNIAYAYLPAYFEQFRRKYPAIRIDLIAGGTSLDLTRREADIAVRATKKPPEYLIGRKVYSLAWAFYAAPKYLRKNGRPRDQRDLNTHRIIAAEGSMARLPGMSWLDRNCAHHIVARCNTLNGMSSLAEAGFGIALLPDDQFKPQLERLFPMAPGVRTDLWILTHPELRKTERIRLMVNHLFESMRSDNRLKSLAVAD